MPSGRAAAARDGFTAVEHPEPWAVPAKEMRARLADLALPSRRSPRAWAMRRRARRALPRLPAARAEFRAGFDRALAYAREVGCPSSTPWRGVPKGGVLEAAET
ncbi:hypothetical protein [Shinella granuli]|uniref:hypothetical protein n=1 Tax=Shinella granuli TaxID=323621 RepID=UPI0031ED972D